MNSFDESEERPWIDLGAFLRAQGVAATFYRFEGRTTTVAEAVRQLGVARERIVKTLVLMSERDTPVIGIVGGDRRVSLPKLAQVAGVASLRLANRVEVYRYTGFPVGGTPPVGHKTRIPTYMDAEVLAHRSVVGGGGAVNVLMELSPQEIVGLTDALVASIAD